MRRQRKRDNPETRLQADVTKFLALALPQGEAWFTSIPGGNRGATTTPGYRAGTPDMLIVRGTVRDGISVYWIELKADKGVTSMTQDIAHHTLRSIGCEVAVCRSIDQVEEALIGWGFRLRATVGARKAA